MAKEVDCIHCTNGAGAEWKIYFCSLHAAAQDMRDVLKELLSPEIAGFIHRRNMIPPPLFEKAQAILRRAEKGQ